jgi:uncharacterized cupredoxin-like copper-binding protein
VPLALSTGHEVGLAVSAGVFILFALLSSLVFPRFRPQYPGRGLPAFIVVSLVFFVGMLTAVEVFGAEPAEEEPKTEQPAPETTTTQPTTTEAQPTTTEATTTAETTTAKPQATTVQVTETEFKIALPSTDLTAGKITFEVKNAGRIPHDLAIKDQSAKTKLIDAGGSATLTTTLKPGTYELYCSVPGHEEAGMKLTVKVS